MYRKLPEPSGGWRIHWKEALTIFSMVKNHLKQIDSGMSAEILEHAVA
jgi:hypothetical protein